jgi:hypothetical protein
MLIYSYVGKLRHEVHAFYLCSNLGCSFSHGLPFELLMLQRCLSLFPYIVLHSVALFGQPAALLYRLHKSSLGLGGPFEFCFLLSCLGVGTAELGFCPYQVVQT